MHQRGEEIIASGFNHVVAITNYHDDDKVFQTPSRSFYISLDFELHESQIPPDERVWHWNEHECMLCLQDGELQGMGIYVFFNTPEGAAECRAEYVPR